MGATPHTGVWEIFVLSAVRTTAFAGVLVTGLFIGGVGSGLAVAEPDDPPAQQQDATDTADSPPEVRVVAEVEPNTPSSTGGRQSARATRLGWAGARKPQRRLTIYIPLPRVPRYDGDGVFEYPRESPVNFVVIEAPIVKSVKAARAILQPEPSPDPSFRGGEEEEPPVLEAAGDSDGAFTADGPPVLEAPLAIAAPRGAPGPRRRALRRLLPKSAPAPPDHRLCWVPGWGPALPRCPKMEPRRHPRYVPRRRELRWRGRATGRTCVKQRSPRWPSSHWRASWDCS